MKALSIRHPWAWLIVNGYKDIENRDWKTSFRGKFLVHASARMTLDDYVACTLFLSGIERGWTIPPYHSLRKSCGGFVGVAELTDCVNASKSPWFCGEYGFVLKNAQHFDFVPAKGMLKFFDAGCFDPEMMGVKL